MSNHEGSYLLNYVFETMDKYQILGNLAPKLRNEFIAEITHTARCDYDCNAGEILQYVGEKYNICYWCYKEKAKLNDGVCSECEQQWAKT